MTSRSLVSVAQARELLNFAGRPDASGVSPALLDEQLMGAVAAHNLLESRGLAYIADEVGTGKTLIAAGTLALLRHRDPTMRALVIAPRINLQEKWHKELRSFAQYNVTFRDLRVRGLDDEPARPLIVASGLKDLLAAWDADPGCDVIARLSSFQLGHRSATVEERRAYIDQWLPLLAAPGGKLRDVLTQATRTDSRRQGAGVSAVKEAIAACVNRLIPQIGVLVVDESHNLKGGICGGAARNRVLWTLLGLNPDFEGKVPGYGPRVERVLMLSATPMEDETEQLRSQLEVLGLLDRVPDIEGGDEQRRLDSLRTFLFRRLRKIHVGDEELTRNRYREEWRAGGTIASDEALRLDDSRARLTVAVVQKRVADALNNGGGIRRFQIGMLTSFESLAESTQGAQRSRGTLRIDGDEEDSTFDDAEQNRLASDHERRGIDHDGIRELVQSHRREFGRPPVHPKMDAVVDRIVANARRGRKTLVFTRRVASVDEMVQQVNDRLDEDLEQRIRFALPGMKADLDQLFTHYEERDSDPRLSPSIDLATGDVDVVDGEVVESGEEDVLTVALNDLEVTEQIRGGTSLFAWLFRGSESVGLLTGMWLRQRLERESGAYVTLLRDNYVAAVLSCEPAQVETKLRAALPTVDDPRTLIDERAQDYLGTAEQPPTLSRFMAAQLAGLRVLEEHGTGEVQRMAANALQTLSPVAPVNFRPRPEPISVAARLTEETLASTLRTDAQLCAELWHPELAHSWTNEEDFRRREWRWRLFSAAVRLDYPAIDLWLAEVRRRQTLATAGPADSTALIRDFLDALRHQRDAATDTWSSYAALRALAHDADLVLQVNGIRSEQEAAPSWVGNRVPAVGMSGRINRTAVRQFRTPSYPLVLITTDLLQEGEDLHTFCDEIHHYGIAWMPSALEQRTGRIDRVNSLTERRLPSSTQGLGADKRPLLEDRLQVLYPYVTGTYEQLQVKRVLARVDEHIRLLHESFGQNVGYESTVDVDAEVVDDSPMPEPETNLGEPYRIDPAWLLSRGGSRFPLVDASLAAEAARRFAEICKTKRWGDWSTHWSTQSPRLQLLGECHKEGRVQPLDLRLTMVHGHAAVRMVSPVGLVEPIRLEALVTQAGSVSIGRLGIVRLGPRDHRTFSVTVEDVMLMPPRSDLVDHIEARVVALLNEADRLEREILRSDQPLSVFKRDLMSEMSHG